MKYHNCEATHAASFWQLLLFSQFITHTEYEDRVGRCKKNIALNIKCHYVSGNYIVTIYIDSLGGHVQFCQLKIP